ncbi:hypothetical protein DSM106972_081150 [Dulcicalothrix desertica PCC 7102]|uniref:Photosystem reaction center subunit H n=1 Tax=Dulcicalothrix desertica PCC 7102 TaxID=232991 RepID=A0A3S1CB73_9CYAN|nr:DUF2382 domain-containing protein [Dulcicalothrix desertica]RUS98486.1 hypothetical protein DSM106972_081150 [Dulcicalothrix desertica PCC 7102]TWH49742.1 uncharacterized protein (TIGR02271 family) [Dulcicalothrix desertica PCC 7102]
MALVKVNDFYPTYNEEYSDLEYVENFDVYAEGREKVGKVSDILVDEDTGRLRYLVVDTGFWIFGKKVLLPIGRARVDYGDKEVYASGLTKEQVENLPNFDELEKVDYDYEEQVRGIYRPMAATSGMTQSTTDYDRSTYNYEQEPSLYDVDEQDNQTLKLYEERLVANKQRRKAGEVSIGKHVETDTARVAIPIEKERVVIERTNPSSTTTSNPTGAFREGEVARMELYEETPDIHKEAVVREEVRVKKVVDRDTVESKETVRREELDIDTDGRPIDERKI